MRPILLNKFMRNLRGRRGCTVQTDKEYYMPARRYEISLRVVKNIKSQKSSSDLFTCEGIIFLRERLPGISLKFMWH